MLLFHLDKIRFNQQKIEQPASTEPWWRLMLASHAVPTKWRKMGRVFAKDNSHMHYRHCLKISCG
ncbi:hypothetical protein PsorP6_012174 [Peronosclerospora sorghi]|uniref:Uncharacterized protein n=1 Tax=Peronosclerospora sorghi TaxID=230839 RepID=A0ACC0WKY9_9STRA|nr:hypothetical protein PsorP6_012174 [Peronosclerospora sorghi]